MGDVMSFPRADEARCSGWGEGRGRGGGGGSHLPTSKYSTSSSTSTSSSSSCSSLSSCSSERLLSTPVRLRLRKALLPLALFPKEGFGLTPSSPRSKRPLRLAALLSVWPPSGQGEEGDRSSSGDDGGKDEGGGGGGGKEEEGCKGRRSRRIPAAADKPSLLLKLLLLFLLFLLLLMLLLLLLLILLFFLLFFLLLLPPLPLRGRGTALSFESKGKVEGIVDDKVGGGRLGVALVRSSEKSTR
mmetsp:Transcript_42270/g.71902  ORF Transcript_42270/g.71902 Transcript_42270/m.71902 type:complete len:243 (+) Transcript_42270:818-1546(+)